jgi:glycosyltransferase involved in cell wall biosynthesis
MADAEDSPIVTTRPQSCSTIPTVLVYRSSLLPYSETFIKEQILAYRSWRGILVGRSLLHQMPLDGLDVHVIDTPPSDLASRALAKVRLALGRPAGLQTLLRENVRLVHAHFGPDALEALPIARGLGVPMAVTLHGYDINIHRDWWEAGYGGAHKRHYPGRLLALAHRSFTYFIAVSNSVRAEAIRVGIPAEKVTTRYIGVDVAKFKPGSIPLTERGQRILFIGRLVEKKGCKYLLQAVRLVKSRIPQADLTIVGDGPQRKELEALSEELKVGARFLGALPSDAVKRELDEARVLCLPSIRAGNGDAEGFGLVLLEAQACGVPVVTSARGGAQEGIIHGETGYEFAEKDVDEMALRLIELLTDDAMATQMGRAAPRFVAQHFDISTTTTALETVYAEKTGVSLQ